MLELQCDACEFACSLADDSMAYDRAREHESEHPTHNVLIYES